MSLSTLVAQQVMQNPNAVAVRSLGKQITYQQLDSHANQIARALLEMGVKSGDRVGIWLPKSIDTVVAMQGVLKAGAAYVPIDPMSPKRRAQTILSDCQVQALITQDTWTEKVLIDGLAQIRCLTIGKNCKKTTVAWEDLTGFSKEPLSLTPPTQDSLAYILYTSGSTGRPKGVCISHENALAFIRWAAKEVRATKEDRFSNHAPFHFDLSVFDLYVAFSVGASVSLIPENLAYSPSSLLKFIQNEKISIWYSVPSVLVLLIEHGNILEIPAKKIPFKLVIFAGEPFPSKYLGQLKRHLNSCRFFNFYGPTETNVCTYYEVHKAPEEDAPPVPIGVASCGNHVWAVTPDGDKVAVHEKGELLVSGPTVMLGYWGNPHPKNTPYKTGDLVRLLENGNYAYLGRRDQMVKVRGHRIELGEIETVLLSYPGILEAAALVIGSGVSARIFGCISVNSPQIPSILQLKQHCMERLPRYMIIHEVLVFPELPKTRNGKLDRLCLSKKATQSIEKRKINHAT